MRSRLVRPALFTLAVGVASISVAHADCESDMLQLEDAMKAPGQTPDVQAAYRDGAAKAASAMRKDDDTTCHTVIGEALAKSGKTLK